MNISNSMTAVRFSSTRKAPLLKRTAALAVVAGSVALGYGVGRHMSTPHVGNPPSVPQTVITPKVEEADPVEALLYPPSKPFKTHMLPVSKIHTIYVEESGNPNGYPVFYLHGGPGAGLSDYYQRMFDPKFFHIIGFEQRGCGRSTPLGDLRENTTWELVDDIQRIRKALNIDKKKYLIFGGSWGSLLALAAAQKHPEDVSGVIMRGISLGRPQDTAWSTQVGRGMLCKYPEAGEYLAEFLKDHPFHEEDIRLGRDPMLGVFDRIFNDPTISEYERLRAVKYWNLASSYIPGEDLAKRDAEKPVMAYAENLHSAKIVCRYYYMNGFMDPADQLLKDVHKMRNIPHIAVYNGREDENTPALRAWEVHKALKKAGIAHDFKILEEAGHSAWRMPMAKALIDSVKQFQTREERRLALAEAHPPAKPVMHNPFRRP